MPTATVNHRQRQRLAPRRSDEERNQLVLENLPLVGWVLVRVVGPKLAFSDAGQDLAQVGRIGLMRAAELYAADPWPSSPH
jgi:DNA-directed RNA polymerase specialized sigma subunit